MDSHLGIFATGGEVLFVVVRLWMKVEALLLS